MHLTWGTMTVMMVVHCLEERTTHTATCLGLNYLN